jgi:diketogulonate reductase-like aldo/keto reductase
MEYVTVRGVEVPAVGFGTAARELDHEGHREAVATALAAGYRHLDTAQMYDNERAVGEAIAASDVDRGDLFVTTKLAGDNRAYDAAVASTRASLDRLGLDYVDLLLIHYPNDGVPHEETLRAMNDLRDDGLVCHLGVSNFSVEQLRAATDASDAPVLTNQVKYNVRHRRDDLLRFCVENEVMLTAYTPVAGLVDDPALAAVGDRHGKTPAQVALRWLIQQPTVSTPPQSSSPAHVRENFDVFDFELPAVEMRDLFALEGAPDDDLAAALGI